MNRGALTADRPELQNLVGRPENLQALLQQIISKTGVPGISAALLQDGHVTSAAAGLRTTSTPSSMCTGSRFAMGSMGKFLFCMSAMESIVSHQIDCNAALGTYLPELKDSEMGRNVALWHLMSHTSGCYQRAGDLLEAVESNADWASVVRRSIAARPLFAPGTAFSYDVPNYVLCGEILRRLHGLAPRDLIRTRILDPLGIECGGTDNAEKPDLLVEGHMPTTSGAFELAEPDEISELWEAASSSLPVSMPDLARIAAAVMDAPGAGAVLSADARGSLLTQSIVLPVGQEWPVRDCALMSYGFGCGKHRNRTLGHPGERAGQCCALHFDPERKIAVAVGVNARALGVRDATLTMLMRSLGCSNDSASSKRPTFERGELPGDYVGGSMGRVVEVREQDSGLICRFVTSQESAQSDAAERKFPVVRFHLTDEGHAELDEQSRQFPMCFFRDPGGTTPCLFAGAVCYRQVQGRFE